MPKSRWMFGLLWSSMLACNGTGGTDPNRSSTSTAVCDTRCQDEVVGYALDETMWLLWNENLAGHPSGAQNLTVNCPLGGNATLTGTTGVASNGINTIHLTITLQDCKNSNSSYSLAFTGTLTWGGTFSSSNPNAVTFQADALAITGTVRRYDLPQVSERCAVSLTDTFDDASGSDDVWLNGEICGRAVSE